MSQKYLSKVNTNLEKMIKLNLNDINVSGGETVFYHCDENGYCGWASSAYQRNLKKIDDSDYHVAHFPTAKYAILYDLQYGGSGLSPAQEFDAAQKELQSLTPQERSKLIDDLKFVY